MRVVDLGLGVAGPFTGRVLADLGADVIKVHALHDGYWSGTHMGLGTNRGKRSIAVNLKDPAGREVLDRLLATADVLTLNWRPGAAARLGIDFETLRESHPRLIHCNTRGYEKGARSDLPGTDQTAAALTGTEWEDGARSAGNPPLWSRSNMGDTGNALLAAIAITIALLHRDRMGVGQAVSTSIVNAGLLHTSYACGSVPTVRSPTGVMSTKTNSDFRRTTACTGAETAAGLPRRGHRSATGGAAVDGSRPTGAGRPGISGLVARFVLRVGHVEGGLRGSRQSWCAYRAR